MSKKLFFRKTRAKRNWRILNAPTPFFDLAERVKSLPTSKVWKNSAAEEERVSSSDGSC